MEGRRDNTMASWGITSESQVRAQARYDAANTVRISLKLNIHTDQDIITWLCGQKTKQGAIKQLIREKISTDRKVAGIAKKFAFILYFFLTEYHFYFYD